MKELDRTKKYDLSRLNDEQLTEMLSWLLKNDSWDGWDLRQFKEDVDKYCLYYRKNVKDWYFTTDISNSTCATELFTTDYEVTMIAEAPNENPQSITDEALLNYIPEIEKKVEQTKAYKETSNKLNYELDFYFITQMAERMAQNKYKYEPYNWQKLDNIEDLKQALFRHVLEVMNGNYQDDGREFAHLESIALNAMFINYQLNNNETKQ